MEMRAKLGKVAIDDNNKELVAFAENIDFSGLFDHINTLTGIECDFYQPIITTYRNRVYMTFKSHNVVAQTGLFAAILKKCYFHSFSNRVSWDRNIGEPYYWVNVKRVVI